MKLENEDALDNFTICHKCYTLNEELPIKDGSSACCSECGNILYRYDSKLITNALALSITGLIFFILANLFPLVQMDILGSEQFITIPKTIFSLFDNGFYLVGLLCAFLIFIFPLMIFVINIILFTVDESFSISVTALTGKLVESLNGKLTLAYISSSNDDRNNAQNIDQIYFEPNQRGLVRAMPSTMVLSFRFQTVVH